MRPEKETWGEECLLWKGGGGQINGSSRRQLCRAGTGGDAACLSQSSGDLQSRNNLFRTQQAILQSENTFFK